MTTERCYISKDEVQLPIDLGDGLLLRNATIDDTEQLAEFVAINGGDLQEPEASTAVWTRALMEGNLPNFGPQDWTLVEHTPERRIVSTLNLISQTWSYGGINFGVGRIDAVMTHQEYRRRGLIRAQMDLVHQWSARRGEQVQSITGIPWFYRQFGYEFALTLNGGRGGYAQNVPYLSEDDTEPYKIRQAREEDLGLITHLYSKGMERYLVSCVRDKEMFTYDLNAPIAKSTRWNVTCVIESQSGESIGMLRHGYRLRNGEMVAGIYELKSGTSWMSVTPSVVRYLSETGKIYATRQNKSYNGEFALSLGTDHPAYEAMGDQLPKIERSHIPAAWYIRLANLPKFVMHIAPVLEQRLVDSVAADYTGKLNIGFTTGGLRIFFLNGKLSAERRLPTQNDLSETWDTVDALFPGLTFLQLLFGFRTLEDIEYAYPDCLITSVEARSVLKALFPKRPSMVYGIQ